MPSAARPRSAGAVGMLSPSAVPRPVGLDPFGQRERATTDAYHGGMGHVVGTIRVEPLDATFGAVVRDVLLARASDATIAELTELWLETRCSCSPAST
jgi:hypothetical protein